MSEEEFVFADGHEGPMVRWRVSDGAVYKDDKRVLTLGRVQEVLVNNLNGRVRIREVRLLLDDGQVVSFGSYGGSVLGGAAYHGFKDQFFHALAAVAPEVPVDSDAAVLPKFVFDLFVIGVGLLFTIIAISKGNVAVVVAGVAVVAFGVARAYQHRPWNSARNVVSAATYARSND